MFNFFQPKQTPCPLKEFVGFDNDIMDLPGPQQTPTLVLDPKPAPSMADLVCSRFPNHSQHSLPIFRPFLVLWRWMEVCSIPLLHISLLIGSFIRLYHSTRRRYGCHSPADFHCQCDHHVICSTCQNGSSPLFTRTRHGSQLQKAISILGKQQSKTPASPSGASTTRFKWAKLDHLSSHQDLSKSLFSFCSSFTNFSASSRLLSCSSGSQWDQQTPRKMSSWVYRWCSHPGAGKWACQLFWVAGRLHPRGDCHLHSQVVSLPLSDWPSNVSVQQPSLWFYIWE